MVAGSEFILYSCAIQIHGTNINLIRTNYFVVVKKLKLYSNFASISFLLLSFMFSAISFIFTIFDGQIPIDFKADVTQWGLFSIVLLLDVREWCQ